MNNYIPIDSDGVPFTRPAFWLNNKEYAKIYSEINNAYMKYSGIEMCTHTSFGIDGVAYTYWFENHGFNKYNIYARIIDTH